ncbi:hypothetical protein H9P43_004182 [Blastocladiella emersonii ATCC 22665]|nr:hypothetical protein H9P43_004182 [Blastocladiella emersonii ATCC 22665]
MMENRPNSTLPEAMDAATITAASLDGAPPRPPTVLVTGGCGYIGSHTCLELLQAGYRVVVLDDLSNATRDPLDAVAALAGCAAPIPFYHASVLDDRALDAVFRDHRIDAVIHMAALKVVAESVAAPLPYYHTNVTGLLTLLAVMRRHAVRRLIFSSSAAVYGELEVAGSPLPLDGDSSDSASGSDRDGDPGDGDDSMDSSDIDAALASSPPTPPLIRAPSPPPLDHDPIPRPLLLPHHHRLRRAFPRAVHSPRLDTGVQRTQGARGVQERDGTHAVNPYGRSKEFCERILRDVAAAESGWTVTILRYFNPCGAHPSGLLGENPRGAPSNLMPFLAHVVRGDLPSLNVYGNHYPTRDGTAVRDYVHVLDLAAAHVCALRVFPPPPSSAPTSPVRPAAPQHQQHQGPSSSCAVYNLGTGQGTTVLEMVRAMERVSGRAVPLVLDTPRPGDVACVVADSTLARRELRWTPHRSVEDMCRDTWNWVQRSSVPPPRRLSTTT